jgi:U3 small nucleolar RNA-associated protein MPP10
MPPFAAAIATTATLQEIAQFVDNVAELPEVFARPDAENASKMLSTARHFFALGIARFSINFLIAAKSTEIESLGPLSELIIDGFDHDQIWEEIQLRNGPTLDFIERGLAQLSKALQASGEVSSAEYGSDDEMMSIDEVEDASDQDDSVDSDEFSQDYSEDGDEMASDMEDVEDLDGDDGEFSDDATEHSESLVDEVSGDEGVVEHESPQDENNVKEDGFFSLKDMEKFADYAPDEDDQDDIDYTQGIPKL